MFRLTPYSSSKSDIEAGCRKQDCTGWPVDDSTYLTTNCFQSWIYHLAFPFIKVNEYALQHVRYTSDKHKNLLINIASILMPSNNLTHKITLGWKKKWDWPISYTVLSAVLAKHAKKRDAFVIGAYKIVSLGWVFLVGLNLWETAFSKRFAVQSSPVLSAWLAVGTEALAPLAPSEKILCSFFASHWFICFCIT